jgi:hypothetical protein
MSFAIMGILILILGSASTVYLVSVNRDHTLSRIEESHFEKMRNAANLVHQEIETQAYFMAMTAVYTATQVLHNQTKIMPLFNESFGDYIEQYFPKTEGNYVIEVEEYTTGIFLDTMNMFDIIPTNEQESVKLKGKDTEYESKTMSNKKAGVFNETSCITYYLLCGEMNYTVNDEDSARFLRKSMSLERKVESAFPLLSGKLDVLETGSSGTQSPIPRTVKYILTTLAQYKVLQGYGMGELSSTTLDLPVKTTSQVVTKSDVELAVNVAIFLETARLYRTYDEDALIAMDDNFENVDDDDFEGQGSIQELVKSYVNNGTIDAADIIALYLGIEDKEINIEAIIAQGLNALVDQFILKYLDYFHLMDLLDIAFVGVQVLSNAIEGAGKAVDDFVGWLTGESPDERNRNRIKGWVKETLKDEADLPDTKVLHDTETYANGSTYYITLTKSGTCGHWEDVDGNSSTPDEWVEYSWTTDVTYELEMQSGDYVVDFPRWDILRSDLNKLWYDPDSSSDFYDQKYGTSTNKIYVSVREAVKAVIAEVVHVIVNMTDLDISSYKSFSRPDDLNPKDQRSLLEEIRTKVDLAIDTIKKYFSGDSGRQRTRNLIAQLVDEQAAAFRELQDFIEVHYDEFASSYASIEYAKHKLASLLISQSSITEDNRISGGDHPQCVSIEPFSESEIKTKFEEEKTDDVRSDVDTLVTQAYKDVRSQELTGSNNGKSGKPLYIIGGLQNVIDKTENTIVDLITSAVHGFGFIPMGCELVKFMADEIITGGEVVNTMFLQYTKMGVPFEFWDDEYDVASQQGDLTQEIFKVDQEPDYLANGDEIDISISNPSGTHYTSVTSFATRPFVTNWKITIKGSLGLSTRTESRLFLGDGTHDFTYENRTIELDLSIIVTAYSGWNLVGVDYEVSNTLLGDIIDFLAKVWDYLESVVGSVFDMLTKLVESFMDLLFRMISYVAELIKLIVDTISFFVSLIMDFIQFIMDSIISAILEVVADIIGDGITITVFGFKFEIKGNDDVAKDDDKDGDLLWVTMAGGFAGVDLSFIVRVARYHEADSDDPHYDILLDGTLGIGDFDLKLAVDPLMAINSYIIEGHGKLVSGGGGGWGLDFYVPEIEEYREVKWALSDYTSGLNSIPIPFLGISATIDAGFVIQYNAPKGEDIVINEFELNPQGTDEGNEWFEIYNPTEEDIGSWKVSFGHGGYEKYKLSDLSFENDGYYTVYTLPAEILQNGVAYDPFSQGDGLILEDETGAVVDKTPVFKDPGDGDAKTWQRTYDGSVIWRFNGSTQLAQNGQPQIDIKSEIMAALKTSFTMAFNEFLEKELGLDAVIEFVQDWIQNFIDMVLTLISQVVYRVYLFLEIIFEDVSGSAGAGLGLSVGMDGQGLSTILRWLVDTIETFIYNLCNPTNAQDYPSIPEGLPEHIFLRFQVFFEIGTPKIIEMVSSEDLGEIRLSLAVQANVPALVALLGWDWGDWEVIFGAYIARIPSKAFSDTFGTSDEEGVFLDIWLLKARVYEIS